MTTVRFDISFRAFGIPLKLVCEIKASDLNWKKYAQLMLHVDEFKQKYK